MKICPFALLLLLFAWPYAGRGQLSTEDHLAEPGFWPTQDHPSRDEFTGAQTCARCHVSMSATQRETPMARTLEQPAGAAILHDHPAMRFKPNAFTYEIDTAADRSIYSVAQGDQRLSYPLAYAFGTGQVAQSYLFKKDDGNFYEARASYFVSLSGLDFTPSRALLAPSGIDEAMYRLVPAGEVQRCFACHATASSIGGRFDEQHLIPGVSCEACHGPGANHVKLMRDPAAGKPGAIDAGIFNSAHLAPADAVEFCGACHGSWWDVKLSGVKGVSTARSAPYRLVTSKCWGQGDARLTCTACHDPHKQLETDPASYDHVCLTCHVNTAGAATTASHPGRACPAAVSKCAGCHMPKAYVPEMHANFTDHRIRIARAGEPFPD